MHALATVLVLSIVATLLAATVTVASSMSTSRDRAFDARQAIRLRNVLVGSGALLVAALIPPPLLLLGLENDLAWRISAGLAAALVLAVNIDARRTAQKARNIEKTSKTVIAATLILAGGTFGCFVLGVLADYPAFWFVTALLLTLFACLISAARLLFSLPPFDALT